MGRRATSSRTPLTSAPSRSCPTCSKTRECGAGGRPRISWSSWVVLVLLRLDELGSANVALAEGRLAQLALADDPEHREAPMRLGQIVQSQGVADLVDRDVLHVVPGSGVVKVRP